MSLDRFYIPLRRRFRSKATNQDAGMLDAIHGVFQKRGLVKAGEFF